MVEIPLVAYYANISLAAACTAVPTPLQMWTGYNGGVAEGACTVDGAWTTASSTALYGIMQTAAANVAGAAVIAALPHRVPTTAHTHQLFEYLVHRQTVVVPEQCHIPDSTIRMWRDSVLTRAASVIAFDIHHNVREIARLWHLLSLIPLGIFVIVYLLTK